MPGRMAPPPAPHEGTALLAAVPEVRQDGCAEPEPLRAEGGWTDALGPFASALICLPVLLAH